MQDFMHKINSLFISLEALNLEYLNKYNISYVQQNNQINIKQLQNYCLNNNKTLIKYPIQYKYEYITILITILYQAINKNKASELVQLILKKETLLNQYIQKFHHIYLNKYDYYTLNTKYETLKISNFAIINLYLIYISKKHANLIYLIYYLIA